MAVKAPTVGELIKEARTNAKLTQEKLAAQIEGLSASDISKAERNELDLTNNQLKAIAKVTGVTQASLLNAAKADKAPAAKPKATTAKTTTTKAATTKATTAKATTAKTAAKTTASAKVKTTADTKAKTPASATISMKVTASEKKLIELYRSANGEQKKAATNVLKGESADLITSLLSGGAGNKGGDLLADGLAGLVTNLLGGKL